VLPTPRLVASPCVPGASLMVATSAVFELQWTVCVRSCVELSLKVPVAVNCCVTPRGTTAAAGEMSSETNSAAVTISVLEPTTSPTAALTFVVPCPRLVASPALLMFAVEGSSTVQDTVDVRSRLLPSVKVPIAVNCCVVPNGIDGVPGVTAMETRVAGVTVNVVLPFTVPEVASMVADPILRPVAKPIWSPDPLIVATSDVSLVHSTECVRSCVVPSVNVPVAVN